MVFSNMVSEARRVIQESEEKVQGLEQLAQEVYKQACIRIQELVNVAESLYQTNCSKTSEIEKLHMEVQSTRDQLEVQINRNQVMVSQITQFESQMYNFQNLFGHKAAEITRLISEVSRLQSSEARLEESLAALSAAPSSVAARVEARRTSAPVDANQCCRSSQRAPCQSFPIINGTKNGFNDGSQSVFVRQNGIRIL